MINLFLWIAQARPPTIAFFLCMYVFEFTRLFWLVWVFRAFEMDLLWWRSAVRDSYVSFDLYFYNCIYDSVREQISIMFACYSFDDSVFASLLALVLWSSCFWRELFALYVIVSYTYVMYTYDERITWRYLGYEFKCQRSRRTGAPVR